MLRTLFMLFMIAWMLSLVFQFRLGAIPLVSVLTTIMAFIKLIRRSSFIPMEEAGGARGRNSTKRVST